MLLSSRVTKNAERRKVFFRWYSFLSNCHGASPQKTKFLVPPGQHAVAELSGTGGQQRQLAGIAIENVCRPDAGEQRRGSERL